MSSDATVWSRRSVLKVGAGAGLAVGAAGFGLGHAEAAPKEAAPATGSGSGSTPTSTPPAASPAATAPAGQAFATHPELRPPRFEVVTAEPAGSTDGLFLTTPASGDAQVGPMVFDGAGDLVWFRPMAGGRKATNLRMQTYRGKPVLTWWEGAISDAGWGRGEVVIADTAYREVTRVQAADGLFADLHDVKLTAAGTALMVTYHPTTEDLTSIGGARTGALLDSGIQEVDVATGEVVFEWLGRDHVDLTETHGPKDTATATAPYDFLHVNSVAEDLDGNLLLSARHTWTIYKVDRRTGAILWRLGGKRSDFTVDPTGAFSWQHDATRLPDGRISLFDNGAGLGNTEPKSRALVLRIDERARTAAVDESRPHPTSLLASSQGSTQVLDDGDLVAGWGAKPYVTQFTGDGQVRFDGRFLDNAASYRAFRVPWKAAPHTKPTIALSSARSGLTVNASWNGATDVATWTVIAGPAADSLVEVARAVRSGFETTIAVGTPTARLVGAVALDAAGRELGRSDPVRL